MKRRRSVLRQVRLGIACGVFAASLIGCRQQKLADSLSVVKPATIQVDGSEWDKVDWSSRLDNKIANHFRRTPELADNPALRGDAVCYVSGSNHRVYWLSPVEDTCHWAMVEFKGSRGGELVEGSGDPFLELLRVDP